MNKMNIFRIIVFLVILFLPSTHAVGQPYEGLSSVLVEEGKLAAISCVTNAESQSEYFWRKGESLHNSTDIAFFIRGLPTDDSGRFKVTNNGTLIVKKVTLDDEGKYICRVSSDESDCHGEVFLFVKAVLQDFQLTIENCELENSCVISTESTKPTSLTCKATNASPSMKLKWFNGSREIKDNIEENSLTKGPSREISSTIRNVYKAPSPLTCQAVDFKTSNDDGMFAHVQFRTPASSTDISPGWIVTAILFIVAFVILFLIVIFITVRQKVRKGKDVDTQNSAERESLLSKDNELKEKREQILKLETDLRTKNDEIKTKSVEITKLNEALMETNADKRVNESNVTSKDTELKDKREQILKLETDLRTKGDDMKTMSEEINNLKDALMETNADKRVNESNVTSKDKELQDKRQQILKLETSLDTVTGNLSKKNKEHQTQKDNLIQKELQIKKLQSELEHVQEPLTKIQKREQEISSKEKLMIGREAGVKKREDDVNTKEAMLSARDTNITRREDAMNSKETSLKERETHIKKQEDSLKSEKSKLTEQETDIKKQLLDLEKDRRKFRLDQMASKDLIRINCKLIASRTGDDARVSKKEKGGQSKVTAKKKRDFKPKDAKFHTIYQTSAEPKDVCQSIDDLIENAIDGRNSCLIAHDGSTREHWTTMFGPGDNASDALVPFAITKIFKRSEELRALDYKVDVTAKFKTASTESNISESVKNEEAVFKLLKEGHGNIDQVDGSMDHFVQFFITTETDQETLTGTLVLATIGSVLMIKECFLSGEQTTQLTQNISAIISDGRCRSVLLTHIHEDKVQETKDCLAMVNEISKKNKK